ncbi:MAG: molybdopterin molybdotransferase MoeA [Chloroflexota bacterium]
MISVEEALERILSFVTPLPAVDVPLLEALGQVLAEDIHSDIDVPPLDNSAMDGYAVRAADTRGASRDKPITLRVVGDLAAGYTATTSVGDGQAIRIMTGAPLPEGADAVVRFEDTDEGARPTGQAVAPRGENVAIHKEIGPRVNIRDAGEDIHRGEIVLTAGTSLRPSEIGVLASLGRPTVRVHRRPRVAVLATGDELVPLGEALGPGKIHNSNTYSVASQVIRYGGVPMLLGIARDHKEDLASKIHQAMRADLLITSGGVSMGDFDVVKDVLAAEGEVTFWRVRMKPGKPLAFGRIGGVPHLGLPGNPVSSMVTFEMFARPAILKMLGKTYWRKPSIEATLLDGEHNRDLRRVYLRAHVEKRDGQYVARLTGPQGSGILTSMAAANGLAIIPEDVPAVKAGERVRVLMLDWPEDPTL